MRKSKIFFLISHLQFLFCTSLTQELISSTGISTISANLQLTRTPGEPIVEAISTGGTILTQGFHHCKLAVTAIDPIARLELN